MEWRLVEVSRVGKWAELRMSEWEQFDALVLIEVQEPLVEMELESVVKPTEVKMNSNFSK